MRYITLEYEWMGLIQTLEYELMRRRIHVSYREEDTCLMPVTDIRI